MNFKHGFDSANMYLNPDCIMVRNAEIKVALIDYAWLIRDFLDGKEVEPDEIQTAHYLISCCLPHNGHLLPKGYEEKAIEYYRTPEAQNLQIFLEQCIRNNDDMIDEDERIYAAAMRRESELGF